MAKPKSALARYVGLLRGINVGGHKAVSMSSLREFLTSLGLGDVQTLLQSGNVVFSAPAQPTSELENRIEASAMKPLGLDADFIIRTEAQWHGLIDANPFPKMAAEDPSHLVAVFLKQPPTSSGIDQLRASIKGREEAQCAGRELFVTYVDGIGRSKLTNVLIEKCLGTRATARNWNTVLKIQHALSAERQR